MNSDNELDSNSNSLAEAEVDTTVEKPADRSEYDFEDSNTGDSNQQTVESRTLEQAPEEVEVEIGQKRGRAPRTPKPAAAAAAAAASNRARENDSSPPRKSARIASNK